MFKQISFCVLLVFAATVSSHTIPKKSAQEIFDSVPLAVRDDFIKIHLAKGYQEVAVKIGTFSSMHLPDDLKIPEEVYEQVTDIEVPENFSVDLYNWAKKEFVFTDENVYDLLLNDLVCFPDGTCFNPGDVGSICCPL